MAVDTDHGILVPVCFRGRPFLLVLAEFIYQLDEACYFNVRGRYLRHCRELVILDAIAKAFGVVHGISMTDVDNILDLIAPDAN